MSDEEGLVNALVLFPEDEGLLSVYFDWLEEQGVEGGALALHVEQQFVEHRSYLFVYGAGRVTVAITGQEAARWRTLPLPALLPEADRTFPGLVKAAEGAVAVDSWDKVRRLGLAVQKAAPPERRFFKAIVPRYSYHLRDRELSLVWRGPLGGGPEVSLISGCNGLIALADFPPPNRLPRNPLGRQRLPLRDSVTERERALQAALEEEEAERLRASARKGRGHKGRGKSKQDWREE